MSVFILKLIAMLAMLLDHVAEVFGWTGWDVLPVNASIIRCIGRISFPIFAFFIVNGWKYTHNREKYFLRLALCGIVSHIPFTLAFYPPNRNVIHEGEKIFTFRFMPLPLIIGAVCIITYWYFVQKRKANRSLITVSIFFLLPAILLKAGYMWLMADSLNVLYTLAIGCAVLYVIEKIKKKDLRWWEYVWLVSVVLLATVAYAYRADYGIYFMGLILIVALYFAQRSRIVQTILIIVWGIVLYGVLIHNLSNAYATVIPAMLILLYNPEKGGESKGMKRMFYAFYPLHLLIIGLINVFRKLI